MKGMIARRPIGIARDKSKGIGLRKPKERENKPNGSIWQE